MVVATAGAVAIVATGGIAAAAGGAAGVATGFAGGGSAAATVAGSVAAAAGGGTVAGAVTGAGAIVTTAATAGASATVGSVVAGAGAGAAAGAASSAGYTATVAALASGPLGWALLGLKMIQQMIYTFDCWKPIIHDESEKLSSGKLLREIVIDPRVKDVIAFSDDDSGNPRYIIQNVWGEHFIINFLVLPNGQLAAHATLYELLPLMPK